MAITGDYDGLRRMQANLAHMTTPEWQRGLAANLGEEALSQITEGFATETDPYGRPWPPSIRAASQGGQTLSLTAHLRRSFTRRGVAARADGFTVGSDVIYAITHQKGAVIKARSARALRFQAGGRWATVKQVRIPVRQMVPEGNLPPRWQTAFNQATQAYIEETLGS